MRIFGLTDLGKKVASTKEGDDEEMRTLQYLRENKTGTDSELEVVGGEGYVLRR
ncbi:hypothetical protein LCGC14_2621240, partial [marine sediment metagenome]